MIRTILHILVERLLVAHEYESAALEVLSTAVVGADGRWPLRKPELES